MRPPPSGRGVWLALLLGALLAPGAARADDEKPYDASEFDQPVVKPPDPRLRQNRGLWLEIDGGLYAALGSDYSPRGGGALTGGWGFGNGLVVEGQVGAWYYHRTVGTGGEGDGAVAVPVLVGARYRFVTAWRFRPVPWAAVHLGPVITRAWFLGPSDSHAGFGLQAGVGLQIPLGANLLVDCALRYLLDAAGVPEAGTLQQRFGTGHALMLSVGVALRVPPREPYDPLGLRKLAPTP